jgi:hypothetical protein
MSTNKLDSTTQFAALRDHDRVAFDAYTAIYRNHGKHVGRVAPTLDALADMWLQIVGEPLDRDSAQHVVIIKA